MIKLIKAIIRFFNLKAEAAAGTVDSLISAEEKIEHAKQEILAGLEKQKQNAIKLFASQERMKDNLKSLETQLEKEKAVCKELKESGKNKDKLTIAATKYLEIKSVYDEMKASEKAVDNKVKAVEASLRNLNVNKAIVEAKAESLKAKITLYKGMADIDEVGIIDIKTTFEAANKVVEEVKYKINAESKANELVHENDEPVVTNSEVDSFIETL